MTLTPERRAENMRLREAVVDINDVFFQARRREFQERAANDLSLYEAALAEAEKEIERLKAELAEAKPYKDQHDRAARQMRMGL